MVSHSYCTKLSPCAFGFALGITNGLGMLILAIAAAQWGYGTILVDNIASVYHGYAPSFAGGLYGAVWGFGEGVVFGLITGWIYNLCLCCCKWTK
jgi:hypothetical protein